jgi:hypothetical protein
MFCDVWANIAADGVGFTRPEIEADELEAASNEDALDNAEADSTDTCDEDGKANAEEEADATAEIDDEKADGWTSADGG